MKTRYKTSIAIVSSLAIASMFAYVSFDELISPHIESYIFGECELKIFSGDDGTCIQKNQMAYLNWSSIESCTQTDNVIHCDPNVHPQIFTITPEECAELFDTSWSDWVDYAKKAQSDGSQWEPPSKQGIISGSEYFAEFRDTDCRFMVNDWAYLTIDEKTVWRDIPWPELRTYPHEHLNYGEVMVLEAFPKSNPLKGNHYLHPISLGEYPYLWDAINHGTVILSHDEADQFFKVFADKSTKFEFHMPDGTTQIWRMSYDERHLYEDRHLVEAIVFANDIPGDAPNMPYVELPPEMMSLVAPLVERENQFRYQEVSDDDAMKLYALLDDNGIMFSMNDEKMFLKYFGPLLKSASDEN